MTRSRRLAALFLCFAAISAATFVAPVEAQTDRAHQIGGKFMCMCGCNQVLTQCNHIGCTTSTAMLKQIDDSLARGDSETAITQSFVQEFGTTVYAEPPKTGLSLIAWVMPSIYLLAGTLLVLLVISRWRAAPPRHTAAAGGPAGISAAELDRARRRVARETED
jgi:cytochrome c-type biogenesis protein CcmH/NrfF